MLTYLICSKSIHQQKKCVMKTSTEIQNQASDDKWCKSHVWGDPKENILCYINKKNYKKIEKWEMHRAEQGSVVGRKKTEFKLRVINCASYYIVN